MKFRIFHERIDFGDFSYPNPEDEEASMAAWKCRYSRESLTDRDMLVLAGIADAYRVLTTEHTAGWAIGKLRKIRAAVREIREYGRSNTTERPTDER